MQLLIEQNTEEPDESNRVSVFGVSDWQQETGEDGNLQTRLFWPHYSTLSDEETVVDGVVISGGETESNAMDDDTLYEMIVNASNTNHSIVVLRGDPSTRLDRVVLNMGEPEDVTIIGSSMDVSSDNIDNIEFFNRGAEKVENDEN